MKRSQILLAMMGIIAVIAGAFIVVSRVVMASPIHLFDTTPHDSVEYVGMNMCLTCHYDVHQNTWESFQPQVIQSPVVTPQVAPADFNIATAQDVRIITMSSEARAFTTEDAASSVNGYGQQYIMKTEDGSTLVPGTWVRMTQSSVEAESMDSTESCGACHTEDGNHIQLEKQNLSDANQTEADNIRQKIVGTTNTNVDGKLSTDPFISWDFSGEAMLRSCEKHTTMSVRSYLAERQTLPLKALLLESPAAYSTHRRNGLI